MLKIFLSHSAEVFCFKNLLTPSVAETRHGGGLILIQLTHEVIASDTTSMALHRPKWILLAYLLWDTCGE